MVSVNDEVNRIAKEIQYLLSKTEARRSSIINEHEDQQFQGVCQSAYRLLEAVEDWLVQASGAALDAKGVVDILLVVHAKMRRFSSEHLALAHEPDVCTTSETIKDPWDNCEYMLTEDLFEWFTHSLIQQTSQEETKRKRNCAKLRSNVEVLEPAASIAPPYEDSLDTPGRMSSASTEVSADVSTTISSSATSMGSPGLSFGKEAFTKAWCKSWQAELRRSTSNSFDSTDPMVMNDALASIEIPTIPLLPTRPKESGEKLGVGCHLEEKRCEESCEEIDPHEWEKGFLKSGEDSAKSHGHESDSRQFSSDRWSESFSSYSAAVINYFSPDDGVLGNSCEGSDWEDEFLRKSNLS